MAILGAAATAGETEALGPVGGETAGALDVFAVVAFGPVGGCTAATGGCGDIALGAVGGLKREAVGAEGTGLVSEGGTGGA